jgi:hypothetical protein
MGAGAALAMETSDVTLLDSNLEKLEYSISMGRKVTRKIKENIVFSITVKFVVLGFALAGMTHLWAAIASDVGAMILVTLNSMLLLPRKQTSSDMLAPKGDIEDGRDGRLGLPRKEVSSSTINDSDNAMENATRHIGSEKTSNCKKGRCPPNKETASCKKGCCPPKETKETNSCKKGCCPPKETTTRN